MSLGRGVSSWSAWSALVVSAASTLACGGNEEKPAQSPTGLSCPVGQTFDGQYCVADPNASTPVASAPPAASSAPTTAPTTSPAPTTAPSTTPPTTPAPTSATTTPPPVTTTLEKNLAAPVDVSMAAAAAPLIQYLAASHLPAGAKSLGAPFAGQFAEGQVLEQRVSLTPGKCYTVVAAATPPVQKISVAFHPVVDPPGAALPPIVKSEDSGTQAVLGRKNDCYKPPAGQTQVLLVLTVDKGRGVAAAQVFEK